MGGGRVGVGQQGAKWVGDGPEIVSPKRTSVGYGSRPPAWFTVTPYPKCANDGHPREDYSGPLSLHYHMFSELPWTPLVAAGVDPVGSLRHLSYIVEAQ